MIIELDRAGTVEGLSEAITRAASVPGVHALLIIACDANGFDAASVDPILVSLELPLIGGVFPAIMYNKERLERGTLVCGLRRKAMLSVIEHLSDASTDLDEALEQALPEELPNSALQVVLVDGFATRIGALINALHEQVGLMDTIGGGAGSLDFVQRPCLFTNRGLLQDAAVIATIPGEAGVGVAHGWERVSGPYRVTESEDNTIISLDWRPALEVYREAVEAHSGGELRDDNFFDLAKAYPFGITRLDAERIVRDPLRPDERGGLLCVGEVPQGEHVDILHGDQPSLLAAAEQARSMADQRLDASVNLRLFMDCISRVLFLGEDFEQEISAVACDDMPLVGACSIGEIANHGGDYLEFYNKTSVVASLPSNEVS